MIKRISSLLDKSQIQNLNVGDEVLLSGVIYTARDQAHKRLVERLGKGREMPFDIKGAVIYYCGPTQRPRGKIVGSCGPTTSSRMDEFTPALLRVGLKGMIGKGRRSAEVIKAIKKYGAVYFLTYAGCGALLTKYIRKANLVAHADLGPEGIYKLEVKDFPAIVGVDSQGRSIYEE